MKFAQSDDKLSPSPWESPDAHILTNSNHLVTQLMGSGWSVGPQLEMPAWKEGKLPVSLSLWLSRDLCFVDRIKQALIQIWENTDPLARC